jgi:hypothetical protein
MERSCGTGQEMDNHTCTLRPINCFNATGGHNMSKAALALLPLFAITTAVSALILWIALLWDAATGINPAPRSRKKNKT